MVGGAQDGSGADGHLPADADEPARCVHGHAGAQGRVLAHLQRPALGIELAAPADAHAVREAHVFAALHGEAGAEPGLAAASEQGTPQEQARAHARGRRNPRQRRNDEFFEEMFHGDMPPAGLHPQGGGAPWPGYGWMMSGRRRGFVLGMRPRRILKAAS